MTDAAKPAAPAQSASRPALEVAAAAARRAGVSVEEIHTPAEASEASRLLAEVWQTGPEAAPVSAHLLQALAHSGNYVVGVHSQDELVGVSAAWGAGDDATEMHSHITGFTETVQNRGAGFALKLHQRAWALQRGYRRITWTVDPLVRRNMFFNLAKLRAEVAAYYPNFYGPMGDGVNGSDESDRLLLCWDLLSEEVAAACDGRAQRHEPAAALGTHLLQVGSGAEPLLGRPEGDVLRCQIPADILSMRATSPARAARWRRALRETLGTALTDGWRVAEFTRSGDYVLTARD